MEVLDRKGKSVVCFFAESIDLNCTTLSQSVRNWRVTTKNSVFSYTAN